LKYLFKKKSRRVLAALFDAVGSLLFLGAHRTSGPSRNYRHILVLRLDHLGDIFYATAVPQALKENFSGCRVTFLTSSAGEELLKNNPYVDEVLVFDAPWFSRSKTKKAGQNNFWAVARELKKRNFDLALSLRGDLRENFLSFLGGATERVGHGVTGGGFFLTRMLTYRENVHETRHTLDILRAVGISRETMTPAIYFDGEEERSLAAKWSDWRAANPWTLVQLPAGSLAKQWPRVRMEEFLLLCSQKLPGKRLAFIGDTRVGYEWLTDFLKKKPSLPWKDLLGQTTLRELLWLIRQCCLFIGPDSGPTHVAASYGIPTLFLYSGTNVFEEWRSLEENADFIRHPVSCSPCHLLRCPVPGHPCMSGIEPERVVDWVLEKSRGR